MKNFKEIAEKCLAGKLSGTFELASGKLLSSDRLKRISDERKTDISVSNVCEWEGILLYYLWYFIW